LKSKALWVCVSLLLVTTLVMSSCTKTTTTASTATTTASTTALVSTAATTTVATTAATTTAATTISTTSTSTTQPSPQYGGTMTMVNDTGTNDPSNWDLDLTTSGSITTIYINPYLENFFCGDINKYGPAGNGADLFQLPQYIPNQYLMGNIAKSWSFQENPLSLTITLKKGIMWTGNPNIGMAPRELTAADCVFSSMRQLTAPNNYAHFSVWIKDCVLVDNYTFKWEFTAFNANWAFYLLYGGGFSFPFSPESAAAGGSNWRNAVGTGPFELSDFVDGSSVTYDRNPNYWGTATINGKQYQEPFVNKLVYLIVPDTSTELAALRTGKIDWTTQVSLTSAASLSTQASNLVQVKYLSDSIYAFRSNRLQAGNPLANLQVRQALSMATDFNSIATDVYGGGDILGWPVGRGNPEYTPLSGESAAVQALFSDNPTQAKQLLASAGYPNGFTTTLAIDAAVPIEADDAQIIAADWAQIGVTVQIQSLSNAALVAQKNADTYTGYLAYPIAVASALTPISWYQGTATGPNYKTGEPLDVEANAVLSDEDPVDAQNLATQFCKDALLDAGILPMTNPYVVNCYWPWLENYYGETDAAYHNQVIMVEQIWINQTLKTSLGH